jgi:hypothetical protein
VRVWIAGWDISADRCQRIQASFLSQGGATFKRGKGPMAMDLPFPIWLCRPANKTTWGGTGDQASHFGGRVDAGGDCSAGTVWRTGTGSNPNGHPVQGYTAPSGTYVPPHQQTNPNSTQTDNYSTRGNVNPYTGAVGTRTPRY